MDSCTSRKSVFLFAVQRSNIYTRIKHNIQFIYIVEVV